MVLVVRMMLMSVLVGVSLIIIFMAAILSSLQKFDELIHSLLYEFLNYISILNLTHCVALNSLSNWAHTLIAMSANIREVSLI